MIQLPEFKRYITSKVLEQDPLYTKGDIREDMALMSLQVCITIANIQKDN